jgi:hypothetical protein
MSQEGMNEPYNLADGEVAIDVCVGYQMGEVGTVGAVPSKHTRGGKETVGGRVRKILAIMDILFQIVFVPKGTHRVGIEEGFPRQ